MSYINGLSLFAFKSEHILYKQVLKVLMFRELSLFLHYADEIIEDRKRRVKRSYLLPDNSCSSSHCKDDYEYRFHLIIAIVSLS